jgi:hypothetical protein
MPPRRRPVSHIAKVTIARARAAARRAATARRVSSLANMLAVLSISTSPMNINRHLKRKRGSPSPSAKRQHV